MAAHGRPAVQVLLNRASLWLDVDSYLPNEGKVVLRNKQARMAIVRLPLWADKSAVTCSIGETPIQPEWSGRYARSDQLQPGDVVTITFPLAERSEKLTAPRMKRPNEIYPSSPKPADNEPTTITLRGNTIVGLSKPILNTGRFMASAGKYASKTAPLIEVERLVTPRILKW